MVVNPETEESRGEAMEDASQGLAQCLMRAVGQDLLKNVHADRNLWREKQAKQAARRPVVQAEKQSRCECKAPWV